MGAKLKRDCTKTRHNVKEFSKREIIEIVKYLLKVRCRVGRRVRRSGGGRWWG